MLKLTQYLANRNHIPADFADAAEKRNRFK